MRGDNKILSKQIKRLLQRPKTLLNKDWEILRWIGPVMERHVVLDVGSHHGWFYHCWKDWCPDAEVHAFDPNRDACKVASKLYGGSENGIYVNATAVGRNIGHTEYYLFSGSEVSSSILVPETEGWKSIAYNYGDLDKRKVPLISLDEYAKDHHIENVYLLKIDVQGYEMEVLQGAQHLLTTVDHIFVESGIEKLYQNAPRFTDVGEFLLDSGFHLMALRAWHRGNNRLIETDMLFRRNGLEGPIDRSTDRYVVNMS